MTLMDGISALFENSSAQAIKASLKGYNYKERDPEMRCRAALSVLMRRLGSKYSEITGVQIDDELNKLAAFLTKYAPAGSKKCYLSLFFAFLELTLERDKKRIDGFITKQLNMRRQAADDELNEMFAAHMKLQAFDEVAHRVQYRSQADEMLALKAKGDADWRSDLDHIAKSDCVTVYRGFIVPSDRRVRSSQDQSSYEYYQQREGAGHSYTLSKHTSFSFAFVRRELLSLCFDDFTRDLRLAIARCVVRKKDIFAYTNVRFEREIIASPKSVRIIEYRLASNLLGEHLRFTKSKAKDELSLLSWIETLQDAKDAPINNKWKVPLRLTKEKLKRLFGLIT